MKRPRAEKLRRANPHKIDTYTRWKKQAAAYHSFTNRRTVNLTGADKSAVTRVHNNLESHIKAVETGRAVFHTVTDPAKLRALKATGQYIVTNKGFFVYGHNIKKVKVSGKGKKIAVDIRRPQVRERYYSVKPDFDNIVELVNYLFKVVKAHRVRIAFNQYTAGSARTARRWQHYEQELATIEETILGQGYDTPYHGAYAVWDY